MAILGTWRNVEANIMPQAISETSTTQLHKLREEVRAKDTGSNALGEATFVYAQGLASTAVGDIVAIEDDGTTTRAVASGIYKLIGIAMSANVASQYGWYLIIGKENANVATSFADNADCYLTAVAGRIDDAVVDGDYIFGAKGAGAESGNIAKIELNRANTTGGNQDQYTDGITAGTVTASKAVVVDANKDIATFRNVTLSGNLVTGTTTLSETDLAKIDGITNGTQAAGKAVVADANVNTGVSKVTELHIGATGSEVKVDATPAELNTKHLTVKLTDVSTSSSAYVVSPYAGTFSKLYSVLYGTIATADNAITTEINGTAVTDGTLTIAYSGSAAGDVDSGTPSALNTVAVGDVIEVITPGSSTNAISAEFTFVITL